MKQTLKYILSRLEETLRFAETKHSVTLALSSGVIVFASYFIVNAQRLVVVLASSAIAFCLISVLCSVLALMARTIKVKKTQKEIKSGEFLFYKKLMMYDPDKLIHNIMIKYGFPKSYKPDDFDKDLALDIIATSRIINIKFSYFNSAIVFLFVGVLSLVVSIILVGGLL